MPKPLTTPEGLFDRTWRPGHPFRPRISGTRRWLMGIVLLLLCVVIGGYWYITDSQRVANMAEQYLTTLLGGRVKVDQATLSIFEGLRLDGVHIYVDDSGSSDSLLFSAKSFEVHYDPRALLTGKIEATSIRAIDPHVHVVEDVDTGLRNYSRLFIPGGTTSMPSTSGANSIVLPSIVLRNAQVDYTRMKGNQVVENSTIAIEGLLSPIPETKKYSFSFQSRGETAGIGPSIRGEIETSTGKVSAKLENFSFGQDVKSMLPPEVRKWWEQHELAGRVNIPVLDYVPPSKPGASPGYTVRIELDGVELAAQPEEWMGDQEYRTLRDLHGAFAAMRTAGLNGSGFVDHLAGLVEPTKVILKQVHGEFVFSDDRSIQIPYLNGWVEGIRFEMNGRIDGYSPSSAAHIRISSRDVVDLPATPRYVNSLPPAVREIYDRFKPQGKCNFWIALDRAEEGARPQVTGDIHIIDANFTFERFPYPLRKTEGHILIDKDPQTQQERLVLDHIRGRGTEGGPNANSIVEVNGTIGPFGPEAGVNITVAASQISSEPALIAAFPPLTRKALTIFDAPGKGEFPKFKGDFKCVIVRLHQLESHWIVETDVMLNDATGVLVGFPYPMNGITGHLRILDDHLELDNITMKKGDATLKIDGTVGWPSSNDRTPGGGSLKPNLRIVAKDVPIDQDLLNAMPQRRREWLTKIGLGGKFNLEGTIKQATAQADDLDYDLQITLRDGTLWPMGEGFAVTDIDGSLRLTNQRLTWSQMRGKRGNADVSAVGEISWPTDQPTVVIRAEGKGMEMVPSLYGLLPEGAKSAWDAVKPEGTLDAALNYSGSTGSTGGYELVLTPRALSATPQAVPYRLDDLAGTVTIMPDKVILKDLSARHGDAKVRFSGTGALGQKQDWDFSLAVDDAPVDADLRKALPQSLTELLTSMQFKGKVGFEFSRLKVSVPESPTTAPTTRVEDRPAPDVDFAVKLTTLNGSLNVGVPLTDVKGATEISGSARNGKLNSMEGRINIDSFTLGGRPVTKFHANLLKKAGEDRVSLDKMEAAIAKGSMAGQVEYAYFDAAPSRYALNLTLMNSDVRELAGQTEREIQGRLSASLSLEGTYDQPNSRRGAGVVEIGGERMYQIPLVLGLLQITNLSLPITSPFTQATARYSMDGGRVTFEQIELRSREMLMQGSGNLDFNTKQVRMTFVTDSAAWLKLPVIGDLLQTARHELLQIRVRGTLQEPKVSAGSMNTLTTTVDEVFKGDEPVALPRAGK